MILPDVIRRSRPGWPPKSFLARLPDEALAALVSVGEMTTVPPGALMVEEGAADTDVLLVVSGCLKVTAALPEQGTALLAVRLGGDVVGELAAVDGSPRSATVCSCGRAPGTAIRITSEAFARGLAAHPDAQRLLTEVVAGKLRTATRRRIDFAGSRATVRLARVLYELACDHGQESAHTPGRIHIPIDLTQIELGSLVGCSHSTAVRALRELKKESVIRKEGRRVTVTDRDKLMTLAEL